MVCVNKMLCRAKITHLCDRHHHNIKYIHVCESKYEVFEVTKFTVSVLCELQVGSVASADRWEYAFKI